MSLSHPSVLPILESRFVCGWRNIAGQEEYAGVSNCHEPSNPATDAPNGAGAHNVQMVIVSSKGAVLHCLPGHWRPDALRAELLFALELADLAQKPMPDEARLQAFQRAHLDHALGHPARVRAESRLPSFDEHFEREREESTFARREGSPHGLKTVDQVVHEKMARCSLLRFEEFDLGCFVDFGLLEYDAHSDGCRHGKSKLGERPEPAGGGGTPAPARGDDES